MTDCSIQTGGLPPSIRGCVVALDRCLELLGEIDDATFIAPSSDHGTIGAHLRHCIEYFRCFCKEQTTGLVEYDAREREPALETDRELSRCAIEAMIRELGTRHTDDLDRTVKIQQSLAPGEPAETILSTVRREWMSLSDHTIHHLAIITQLIAARETANGGRTDNATHVASRLGVAFSTEAHRASVESTAGVESTASVDSSPEAKVSGEKRVEDADGCAR